MKAARIVVLSIAIGAGGLAALSAGRSEKLLEAKQQAAAAKASASSTRKTDRPDAMKAMSGMVARAPFVAGEPIREAKLILPSGIRAVSAQISSETDAGDSILPNDYVEVILTRRDRDDEPAADGAAQTSETLLRNVRVLAVDQNVREKDGQTVVAGKTATLELSPREAETLALAQHLGSLSVAPRGTTDTRRDDPKPDTMADRRKGGINVIRFGVSTTALPR